MELLNFDRVFTELGKLYFQQQLTNDFLTQATNQINLLKKKFQASEEIISILVKPNEDSNSKTESC